MQLEDLQIHFQPELPKYIQLANALADWIAKSNLPTGSKIPGERYLGGLFSVTPVTAGKSLNLLVQRGLLSRATGSGTRVTGQGAAPRKLRIALVHHAPISDDHGAWVTPILTTVYAYWQKLNSDIITLIKSPDDYEKSFTQYDLSGMMILAPEFSFHRQIISMANRNFPIVSLGAQSELVPNIIMGMDQKKMTMDMVDYLRRIGHTRIGIINDCGTYTRQCRLEGYMRAMFNARIPVSPDWIIRQSLNSNPQAEKLLRTSFQSINPPTAFILADNHDLKPLYAILPKLNIKIPSDLSIIGYENSRESQILSPAITVFTQPAQKICTCACQQLENMIRHQPLVDFSEFAPIIITRKSCNHLIQEEDLSL